MELVKNKISDKYFVVLDDAEDNNFLVVTPEGKVKPLERHLFGPQVLVDPLDASLTHNLTIRQVDIYREYFSE
ncbi:MAG: hypothetical protein WA081_17750 [Desulfosalsimonadaceae bacterium]|nr:MAG: hypothetical protein C4518_09255 [Desulfobacteraceae bacterium]